MWVELTRKERNHTLNCFMRDCYQLQAQYLEAKGKRLKLITRHERYKKTKKFTTKMETC